MTEAAGLPLSTGIGLRHPHIDEIIETPPSVGWLEVHTENYMGRGGPRLAQLQAVAERFPLSFHGVGLSLGSADEPDTEHLGRIRSLCDRFEPAQISEHIAWSRGWSHVGSANLNDLLPIPYTEEALQRFVRNIEIAQDALGRRLLVENPSTYLAFKGAEMDENVFVAEVAKRSGCGLILDVNNVHVSAHNHGFDARAYLDAIAGAAIGEVHLAGHAEVEIDGRAVLLDDHGSEIIEPVWALYEEVLDRYGPKPTLIEWDTDIPPLKVLLDEAAKAETRLAARRTAIKAA